MDDGKCYSRHEVVILIDRAATPVRRFKAEGNAMTSGAKEMARDCLLVAAFEDAGVPARDDVDKGELEDMMTCSFAMTWSVVMTGGGW